MSVAALAGLGALLADPTRSSILVALLDGRAWTVSELAGVAQVARSTASEHVSRLLDAGIVTMEAQGRHRYVRLAGEEIAGLLEALGALELPVATGHRPTPPKAPSALRYARSCWDHLAGRLAVELHEQLVDDRHLVRTGEQWTISGSGAALLASLGIDLDALARSSRPLVRTCLDGTERRHHLAGGVGAALFEALLERGWIRRGHMPRSIVVTEAGRGRLLGLLADQ